MDLLFRHINKIVPLDEAEFEAVTPYFEKAVYSKGQQLFQPGDHVNYEYFVLKGCLKAYWLTDELKMHILQFAMPEWWTTDYKAHYNRTEATMYLDCMEDSEVLCLTHDKREEMCGQFPNMQYFFRQRTNRGYVALQQRILSLLNNNAKERYEQMLVMYPQLFQKVPKSLIASYLGVTRETLSRLYNDSKK